MKEKRSLYDCMEARYPTNGHIYIHCRKGHDLPLRASVKSFKREDPFIFRVCQECMDFNPDIPFEEVKNDAG